MLTTSFESLLKLVQRVCGCVSLDETIIHNLEEVLHSNEDVVGALTDRDPSEDGGSGIDHSGGGMLSGTSSLHQGELGDSPEQHQT